MTNIDFSKIRNHDGSQDNGFEELVCQLAHLTSPDNADYFVRKEGAGGDAGVECYWKLKDGSEHAWQAKYFVGPITGGQWNQISKSVETALNKHPNLTKYYVCLPRDWTDSRKTGQGGEPVNSAWDKWKEHVMKWEKLAQENGMDVEFDYWCKHEISQMLQTDNPHFAGRALYWFNAPVIQNDSLKKIALNTRESLGERFTPEYHLDLPIVRQIDGLGLTPDWKNNLEQQRKKCADLLEQFTKYILTKVKDQTSQDSWNQLGKIINELYEQFSLHISKGDFHNSHIKIHEICSEAVRQAQECNEYLYHQRRQAKEESIKTELRDLSREMSIFMNKLGDVGSFLRSKSVASCSSKAAILLGEAGIGKSHLLCDISLKRIEESLPTLFILGQHYSGGNPLNYILESLDLSENSYRQVLGALDAAGEANSTRTLIVIDAINEGTFNHEWYDNISRFLSELSDYPNLSIILSCRTTYVNYLLPEELPETRMTQIHHNGFRGYEHRAASKYLAKQGISKPSAPITSPEFSNPLFLKTCCKALKENGFSSFPKGLNGVGKLFSFYLENFNKIINRKKKYFSGEKVVNNAIDEFVKVLFPDSLSGISVPEARRLIDSVDPKPNHGENLMDLLIDEGLLSFDIVPGSEGSSKGREVIRFTYERFSDHFVAQYILDHCVNEENIKACFAEDQVVGKMLSDGSFYRFGGIIEALGIYIPERFGCEFIDFIPTETFDYDWLFEKTFSEGLLWRSPESFTERTVELLNKIPRAIGFHNDAIDILLSLSSEPGHPWNADFLDRNLMDKSLSERDALWSTHIAVSDSEEDETQDQAESIVRTLIDWSLSVNLNDVDIERIRLISMTLMWMTTTSNRKVRDQSTKSLSRILSYSPKLIPSFIEKYNDDFNDPYLLERLYAAIYGAVCNIENDEVVKEIAESVFDNVFKDGLPYPHILMRDYARGIMEFAYARGLLTSNANPEVFRPPYNSEWPIDNPSNKEIDKLVGDEFSSIKSSVMGFIGDFGKYTMSCVHDWSPTPLSEEQPESSYEIHLRFAEILPDQLKDRYLLLINKKIEEKRNDFDLENFLDNIKIWGEEEETTTEQRQEKDEWEALKEKIKDVLDDEQKEYFRWVSNLSVNDRPAAFSRKWAQRWVCKRAHELGWDRDLFENFERMYAKDFDRQPKRIERIGKKYQWIAFHELLAKMSDNLHWIDRGYSDVDDSKFWGPWQIHLRDVDPTLCQRKTGASDWDESKGVWWQPYIFPFVDDDLDQVKSWLWDRTIIPPFPKLLKRTNPINNKNWTVLRGFSKSTKDPAKDKDTIPSQDGWFRINTCIVKKEDVVTLKEKLKGENLCDPDILSPWSSRHQAFLREYPWHPSYKEMVDWIEPHSEANLRNIINVKHLIPTNQYEWESGSTDNSIDETISLYLPNKQFVSDLGLNLKPYSSNLWLDMEGSTAFIDPSVNETGPSYGLIRSDLLDQWLEKNNLQIVWLVGGEKQLFTYMADKFYGRLVYSGLYTVSNDNIDGEMWFIEEPGREED
ncbi:hypothetical protein GCM10008934_21020 [Virgibacillus salarius]|uniref:AVAST type 2 anti-phage system protein Avs2 n=1 Tax=Virgibacillus salarius TaxID=447199 RepID=UPI0031CFA5E8